jgi:hypothetical protein
VASPARAVTAQVPWQSLVISLADAMKSDRDAIEAAVDVHKHA